MPKDWGEKWKIRFIPKHHDSIMNKPFLVIILAIVIGAVSTFALSPYFTESTIDEALPTGAINPSEIQDKNDSVMEETMEKDDSVMEETIPISYAGTFVGVGDGVHDAQGETFTIPLEDRSNVLRLENFKSTNGPDLYVYLSTDENASEFINLGKLKANKGNQNYEIPNGVDLDKYNNVLIWCKAFGVLFGSADLSSK